MKKIFLLLIAVLSIHFSSYSQKEDFAPPAIVPPSPTAYELGKYGFGETGLFTGTVNINIPLYTYTSGKLSVPISLSYNSNGIKVDQLSSNVGLGWVLNAGGVVTRIIKGKSDEYNNLLFPKSDISEHGVRSPMAIDFFEKAGDYSADSESDIYAYNFNGYSGKFVYTKENKLIMIPHKDLKIEPYAEDNYTGFLITTPDGVQYIFLEEEINMNRASGNGWYLPGPPDRTSWYLSKIVHPNGDTVEFIYEAEAYSYVVSISESIKIPSSSYQRIGCSSYTAPGDYQIDSVSNNLTVAGKRLKQIKSNSQIGGTIDFSYSYDHPSLEVKTDYKLVSNISIKNQTLVENEKIDLEYLFTANERPFLTKIKFKDPAKKYELEYYDPNGVPKRLDFGQDHWGYSNGENNLYKFPNPQLMGNYIIPGEFRNYNIGANREVNKLFAEKGLLKKVTYPTGGNTEYEYEPNSYYGTKKVYPNSQTSYLEVNTDSDTFSDEQIITLTNIQSDQKVDFYKSINFNDYESECGDISNYPAHHILATVSITNLSNTSEATIFEPTSLGGDISLGNSINITPENLYANAFIELKAGINYEIKLRILRPCLRAAMNLTYFEGAILEVDDNIEIGGLRVKKVSIFDPVKSNTEYKRFYYGKKEALNKSTGQFGVTPFYVTNDEDSFIDDCNTDPGLPSEFVAQYKLLNSSSVRTLYESSIGTTSYKYVTISDGGDNFENGGEEHEYIIGNDYPGNPIWGEYDQSVTWTNAGWNNGLEKNVRFFKKDISGNNFIAIKDIQNEYKEDNRNYNEIKSYAVRKKYERYGAEPETFYVCTSKDVQGGENSIHYYVKCNQNHNHQWINNKISNLFGGVILFPQFPADIRVCRYSTDQVLKEKKHKCLIENKQVNDTVVMSLYNLRNLDITEYKNISYWYYLDSTTVKQYDINGQNPVTTATKYIYDNEQHIQLTRTQTNDSEGNTIETKMFYPDDVFDVNSLSGGTMSNDNISAIDSLKFHHRINIPLQTDVTKNGSLFRKRIIFKDWLQKANGLESNIVEPSTILSSKGTEALEPRLTYHDYDAYGNPLEVSKADGTHIFYVWGYDHSKPIAKIENAKQINFTADQNNKIATAITASDSDTSDALENTLRQKLEDLRLAFDNSQITTYTYDPLIGVTSITDPSGYTSYYVYDDFNRLQYIKDKDGNVLEQYRYNYALEELVANATSSTPSASVGDAVIFSADVTGGSGNFKYEWTVPGESNLPNANQISITTTSSHMPSLTATCKITDNQTLESVTVYKTITVSQSYPALSVANITSSPGSSTTSVGSSRSYSIVVSGGSGSYNYKWTKTNSQYTLTLANGSASSITNTVQSDDCDEFTIKCEVTDNITGEVITKTKTMYVIFGCNGGGFSK